MSLEFVKDYKENKRLRHSFNALAIETFGQAIDFEAWYQAGYWNDNYMCFSYAINDRVIANVSINKMTLVVEGEYKEAIQVGTVMTHPDYRRQGLAQKLLDKVFECYEDKVDYIYLFANDAAKALYLKCGFEAIEESKYLSQASIFKMKEVEKIKLDIEFERDLSLLKSYSSKRHGISKRFGVEKDHHLIMFYCSKFMKDSLYYLREEEAIVSYGIDEGVLNIYDVICQRDFELINIVEALIDERVETIVYHFTPDMDRTLYTESPLVEEDSSLLVKGLKSHYQGDFRYPMFSHA